MKVTAKTEYACIAMIELAANHRAGQPTRIKAIAEAHGIKPRFLVQILLQLKTAGLVISVRGAAGGYQLARAPEKISLSDILQSVEDRHQTIALHGEGPPSSAALVLLSVWKDIQAAEQRLLEKLSLADLLRRMEPTADLIYQI